MVILTLCNLILAFKFCLKYSRRTEFRKLCDNVSTRNMNLWYFCPFTPSNYRQHIVCITYGLLVFLTWNFVLCFLVQLRNHLNNAIKHQGQPNTVNLTNPETLQLHLETRLAQLESAINMELWQVCELLPFVKQDLSEKWNPIW